MQSHPQSAGGHGSIQAAPIRRAQLVLLTDKGRQAFDAAMRLQAPWINNLADGLLVKDIKTVHQVITALRGKLEDNDEPEEQSSKRTFTRPN